MRGSTLSAIMDMARAEAGISIDPSLNKGLYDTVRQYTTRTITWLWNDHPWSHLKVWRDVPIAKGQRYYNFPIRTTFERILLVTFKFGKRWYPMSYGIDWLQYNVYDSQTDERSWPVTHWDIAEDPDDTSGIIDERSMYEIWPVPSTDPTKDANDNWTDGIIRFTAIRTMADIVNDDDRVELDDNLIALFVASELLQRTDQTQAQLKAQQAAQLYARLKGQQSKNRKWNLNDGVYNWKESRERVRVLTRREGTYPYP